MVEKAVKQRSKNMQNGKGHKSEPDEEKDKRNQPLLSADYGNIAVLVFLYVLQGIPLGISHAIPLVLSNNGVSYKEQAEFSFAIWPFSVKLLWAPVVDSVYFSKFGRRKSWLGPVQYLIGIFMLGLSYNIDQLLSPQTLNVTTITIVFFILNFLAATQDIVVDGWALTMLKK